MQSGAGLFPLPPRRKNGGIFDRGEEARIYFLSISITGPSSTTVEDQILVFFSLSLE
jgi:hypothetical protein